jgi:uncharacterized protein YdeI (YjbR/CyaY-like superfamily)
MIVTRPRRIQPRDRAAWRRWLERHHATSDQVFVVFCRKGTGPSITYAEAVEEALCFGWIDGRKDKVDATHYSHRFTPRRAGSTWSTSNERRVAALAAAGKLHPAGQKVIDAAKRSGAWAEPTRVPMPAELAGALRRSAPARRAYENLAPSQQRPWRGWVGQARQTETRARRAATAVAQLAAGHKNPWSA